MTKKAVTTEVTPKTNHFYISKFQSKLIRDGNKIKEIMLFFDNEGSSHKRSDKKVNLSDHNKISLLLVVTYYSTILNFRNSFEVEVCQEYTTLFFKNPEEERPNIRCASNWYTLKIEGGFSSTVRNERFVAQMSNVTLIFQHCKESIRCSKMEQRNVFMSTTTSTKWSKCWSLGGCHDNKTKHIVKKIFFNNTSIRVEKWQWLGMQRNNDKFCKHHGEQSLNMTKHIVEIFFNNTRDKCGVKKWQCLWMQRNNNKFCKHQQWQNQQVITVLQWKLKNERQLQETTK